MNRHFGHEPGLSLTLDQLRLPQELDANLQGEPRSLN